MVLGLCLLFLVEEMQARITVGVDTHAEVQAAAALDQLGRQQGTHASALTPDGGSYSARKKATRSVCCWVVKPMLKRLL